MSKKGISKNVWWMGITSLLTDISSQMIFPILPLFLTITLGVNTAIIGLIEGIAESTASILKTFSGYISDKIKKRKNLTALGYGISTLAKPFFALALSWPSVLVARFADRVGKGVRDAPRDALISESMKKHGTAFGFHRMMDTSGAVIGVVIASILLWRFGSYRLIFWISLIPAVLAVMAVVLFVKDIKFRESKKMTFKHIKKFSPNYKRFLIVAVVFALGNVSYAFLILRARSVGIAIALIPIIYLVYNLAYVFFAYPFGKLSDKIGKKKLIVIGYLIFALTMILFGVFNDSISIWLLFGLYGLYMAITEGVSKAFISDLTLRERRATALGAYQTFTGLMLLPANLIVGVLWYKISIFSAFTYSAVLGLIAAILLVFIVKEK